MQKPSLLLQKVRIRFLTRIKFTWMHITRKAVLAAQLTLQPRKRLKTIFTMVQSCSTTLVMEVPGDLQKR
jgi:hypothetical protein